MNVIIKDMETIEEIQGKAFVHYSAWQEAYSGIVDQSYLDSMALDQCEEMAFQWKEQVLIAKDRDKVIGFAKYMECRDEDLPDAGEIAAIYILSSYYGRGIGYRLMKEAVSRLQGYPRIVVWALKDNTRAICFYKRFGFQEDGKEKIITLGTSVKEIRLVLYR